MESKKPRQAASGADPQTKGPHIPGHVLHQFLRQTEGPPGSRDPEDLSAARVADMAEHLKACSACTDALASYRALASVRQGEETARQQELARTAAMSDARFQEVREAQIQSLTKARRLLDRLRAEHPPAVTSALSEIGQAEYALLQADLKRGDSAALLEKLRTILTSTELSPEARIARMKGQIDRLLSDVQKNAEGRQQYAEAIEVHTTVGSAPIELTIDSDRVVCLAVTLAFKMLCSLAEHLKFDPGDVQRLAQEVSLQGNTVDFRPCVTFARERRPLAPASLYLN